MRTAKDIFIKAPQPNIEIDSKIIETFREKVNEIESKSEHVSIGYYELPVDPFWDYVGDEYVDDGFIRMEKTTVIAIFELLKSVGIEKNIYAICSIIQTHRCREILSQILEPAVHENLLFPKEFYTLYQVFMEEVQEIKFITNKKDKTGVIKNKNLIHLLFATFKESILNLDEAVEYIYEFEMGEVFDSLPENRLLDSAIINLLVFLQTKTDYQFNIPEAQVPSFSNKQFELIYNLLVIGCIIKDDEVNSPPKDYIRIRTQRILAKRPALLNTFQLQEAKHEGMPLEIISSDDPVIKAALDTILQHKKNIKKNIELMFNSRT